jgi:CheY-like chemotaxis protein
MSNPTTDSPASAPVRILLAEDNPGDVWLIQEALRTSGPPHSVTVVSDGQEALRLIGVGQPDLPAEPPDLLVLDLNLPRVDGGTVIERLRDDGRSNRIPVVLLSSSTAPWDIEKASEVPHGTYMTKPSDLDEFMALGPRIWQFFAEVRKRGP